MEVQKGLGRIIKNNGMEWNVNGRTEEWDMVYNTSSIFHALCTLPQTTISILKVIPHSVCIIISFLQVLSCPMERVSINITKQGNNSHSVAVQAMVYPST